MKANSETTAERAEWLAIVQQARDSGNRVTGLPKPPYGLPESGPQGTGRYLLTPGPTRKDGLTRFSLYWGYGNNYRKRVRLGGYVAAYTPNPRGPSVSRQKPSRCLGELIVGRDPLGRPVMSIKRGKHEFYVVICTDQLGLPLPRYYRGPLL